MYKSKARKRGALDLQRIKFEAGTLNFNLKIEERKRKLKIKKRSWQLSKK